MGRSMQLTACKKYLLSAVSVVTAMRSILIPSALLFLQGAFTQPLVLACCETEQQVSAAQKLVEQAHRKDWRREQWEEACRQQGFEVVGDSKVFYLIPIYYAPVLVERVIMPAANHISRSSPPIQRLNELPPAARSALLSLLSRPSLARFVAQEPSVESFRTKLENGEILIGMSDLWVFQGESESETEEFRLFAESTLFRFTPSQAIDRLNPPLEQSAERGARSSAPKTEASQWSFVFSHSIPRSQQLAHIDACLEWLKTLERQVAALLPEVSTQLWKIFYPNKPFMQAGGSYSLGELQSLLGAEARLLLPPEQYNLYIQKQFNFIKWGVGIELVKLSPDGNGVSRHFVPLEVLFGLRDY